MQGTVKNDQGYGGVRPGAAGLLPHHGADLRARGIAAGRSGQRGAVERARRRWWSYATAADHGDLHDSRGQPGAGSAAASSRGRSLRVDAFDRARLKKIASGNTADAGQPDRHDDGHGEGARAVRQPEERHCFRIEFVNTRLLVNTQQGATLIPSSAIQHNGNASFVYVIQDNTAHTQNVKPGVTEDNGMTAVTGINPGTWWRTAASTSCRTKRKSMISKHARARLSRTAGSNAP